MQSFVPIALFNRQKVAKSQAEGFCCFYFCSWKTAFGLNSFFLNNATQGISNCDQQLWKLLAKSMTLMVTSGCDLKLGFGRESKVNIRNRGKGGGEKRWKGKHSLPCLSVVFNSFIHALCCCGNIDVRCRMWKYNFTAKLIFATNSKLTWFLPSHHFSRRR